MNDDFEEREPFVTLTGLGIIGGALIWAANQDWIELAEFYQQALEQWRDFLRGIWDEIIHRLGISIDFADHQKDMLSLIAILSGSALFRHIFGKPAQSLVHPTYHQRRQSMRAKLSTSEYFIASYILLIVFVALSGVLYTLALTPFVDTVQFTHETLFLWRIYLVLSIALVCVGTIFLSLVATRYIMKLVTSNDWQPLREQIQKLKDSVREFRLAIFAFLVLMVIIYSVGLITRMSGISISISPEIDPTPFSFWAVANDLVGESGIDLLFLLVTVSLLFLTSGRSLKPVAQFVALGMLIVFFGWISGVILTYE